MTIVERRDYGCDELSFTFRERATTIDGPAELRIGSQRFRVQTQRSSNVRNEAKIVLASLINAPERAARLFGRNRPNPCHG